MKNWSSLKEFFQALNEKTNYLVLRNYEEFENGDIVSDHPDIDVLCSDRDLFLNVIDSESRSKKSDKIHRYVRIGDKNIDIDVRHVGDGYYDTQWEKDMLENKIFYNNLCYVMDSENYYYSLLYHALIQKNKIGDDYKKRLKIMANEIDLNITNPLSLRTLELYMKEKEYKYTYPINPSGIVNFQYVNKEMIEQNFYRKLQRLFFHCKRQIVSIIKSN